jgi:DNA-binding phage protein
MDYAQIAKELLTTLRGRRSQVAWSRRLGYRSNVAYSWESGRRWPTAAETFRAIRRSGVDLEAGLTEFYGGRPEWLDRLDAASPEAVAQLLNDLRGQRSITEISRIAQLSRHSVSRWLVASTQPRLPHFLQLVELTSHRLFDLLAAFVDPRALPTVEPIWAAIESRGRADLNPWAHAVLASLELDDYRSRDGHSDAVLARAIELPVEAVQSCLRVLEDTGEISWNGSHWLPSELTSRHRMRPEVARQLKKHWTNVAATRIENGDPGQFSYNVFSVSRSDLDKIRDLHQAYFRTLRALCSDPTETEIVAVANVQLFELD